MFQNFTEKSIELVKNSQIMAIELNHVKIYPEHLLIALSSQKTGLVTKLLAMANLTAAQLKEIIAKKLAAKTNNNPIEFVVFSDNLKRIFERSIKIANSLGNKYIQPEHLFLAMISDIDSQIYLILKEYNFDIPKAKSMLLKIFDKNKSSKNIHPEGVQRRAEEDKYSYILSIFKDPNSSALFERAVAKLSTSKYEIMGTEQIIQSILEDEGSDVTQILKEYGINANDFSEKLQDIASRVDEYEGKQIIFTPNALKTMLLAIETAKEFGSTSITAEHVILGLLKSKSGIAYNIFKAFNIDDSSLEEKIKRPIEKQMNETLVILRFAKQEARRLNKSLVGSELILLGILLEGTGVGAGVLSDLGVTIKDARSEVESIIGGAPESSSYNEKEILFTERAKIILETAWNVAKSERKTKIESQHLLLAICSQPKSVAMQALNHLGVDVIEIKHGLKKKLSN